LNASPVPWSSPWAIWAANAATILLWAATRPCNPAPARAREAPPAATGPFGRRRPARSIPPAKQPPAPSPRRNAAPGRPPAGRDACRRARDGRSRGGLRASRRDFPKARARSCHAPVRSTDRTRPGAWRRFRPG
jgi:hypothetical protein